MYFLMMPFSFRGGSQDTKTVEAEAAAALTPAGGPGTGKAESVRVAQGRYSITPAKRKRECAALVAVPPWTEMDTLAEGAASFLGRSFEGCDPILKRGETLLQRSQSRTCH